jgi:hypothetical protein
MGQGYVVPTFLQSHTHYIDPVLQALQCVFAPGKPLEYSQSAWVRGESSHNFGKKISTRVWRGKMNPGDMWALSHSVLVPEYHGDVLSESSRTDGECFFQQLSTADTG